MDFQWLKKYFPRGLYGRAALILFLPITVILVSASIIFVQRHYEDVARQMTQNLALDVNFVLAEASGATDRSAAAAAMQEPASRLGMNVALTDAVPVQSDRRRLIDFAGPEVFATLRNRVPSVIAIDLQSSMRRMLFWVDTEHGPVQFDLPRTRASASNPHQFLVLVVFVAFFMSLIAFVFLRNQLRPIRRLARAAEAFGRGRVEPYRPSGATEVRSAGNAFLDMRARIERQIEQRTLMLSGVSHDLRTPLTRMRLGLSMLEDQDAQRDMQRDLDDMERLLDAFLDFARADALDDPVTVDIGDLVNRCVEKFPAEPDKIEIVPPSESLKMSIRPLAMERAVSNLLANALRYGTKARASVLKGERSVTLVIEDDGPGIPEAAREDALKPFVRLDEARNQDRGTGVGLGLAITHDIARRHGGTLRLQDSADLGGLRAEIVLPL